MVSGFIFGGASQHGIRVSRIRFRILHAFRLVYTPRTALCSADYGVSVQFKGRNMVATPMIYDNHV